MREKLIELLKEAERRNIDEAIPMTMEQREKLLSDGDGYGFYADHLIASGVVVSKMETTTDKDTNVPSKVVPHKVDTDHVLVGSGIWRRGTTVYKCPKCQTFVMRYCKYCFECGQALEWQTEPPKGE